MRFVLRTDASPEIGSGHVMRCLALAQALEATGHDCCFVTRALPGHMAETIEDRGFAVCLLPAPEAGDHARGGSANAGWLGVDAARDAAETLAIVGPLKPDWLIVDHYALKADWEAAVTPPATRLMAIDDLADRPHRCAVLLDPNLGRHQSDYDGLVPQNCKRLTGPLHALLRPEFAALREQSLARRQEGELRHILVSMGGVDKDNVTGRVLMALKQAALPHTCRITVVLGEQAPWRDDVRALVGTMPWSADLRVGVTDMAALMAAADLAVGGAGTSSWERCCLGLPTLLVVLADNQRLAAEALIEEGAAMDLGAWAARELGDRLSGALTSLQDPALLIDVARKAARVTDGRGARRVADTLAAGSLVVRQARSEDAKRVFEWRNDTKAVRFYRTARALDWREHLLWFELALKSDERIMLMAEQGGVPVCHIRLDRHCGLAAEISICVSPSQRNKGLGKQCLELTCNIAAEMGLMKLTAEVHPENSSSRRIFELAGFGGNINCGGFLYLTRDLDVNIG